LILPFSKKISISGLVVAIVTSAFQSITPALGFDSSDTMAPVLASMKLVNKEKVIGTAPFAIELVVTDDKNWSKVDGTLNIGFSYQQKTGLNLPPNCLTVTNAFNTLEVVENLKARKQESSGATRQVFWLIGFLPAPKASVGSCAEYRNFSLPPAIVLNSSNFMTKTVKGSTTAQVTGGIYSPRITDESGRSITQKITTMLNESVLIPQKLDFEPSQFCLPYSTSNTYKKSGAAAIKSYNAEAELSLQLGVEENRPHGTADLIKAQMLQWENFEESFDLNTLKYMPLCPTAITPSTASKAFSDDLKALKEFNSSVKKDNALKFCTSLSTQIASFITEVDIAKTEFAKTTLISSFRLISTSSFKVDCASTSNTLEKLSEKQTALDTAKKLFSENLVKAQLELSCGKIQEGLPKLDQTLSQAKLKFKGSLYDNLWPSISSEDLLSFCGETTFSYESAKEKYNEFVISSTTLKSLIQEAESALRKRTLKFKITCIKGKTVKKLTVTSPVCPTGYRRSG
jgi:hypothetical protein